MTIIGEAFVAVRPDTKGFGPEAEKSVLGSVTSIAKKAGAVLGGAFAIKKGVDFLSDSVAAARESNKVAAQTEAVIKSTGNAAKVSASQIGDLAESIAAKTGVDDEAIQKGQNLLLTFTNVRNEAGKGNDVFNQATQTLVDMGAALGTDASGSAIQLGKALNDPIKGIAALTRVGVTFTDQQEEQIKTMQKAGDITGAQKVILAELNKEFGGSAAAQATASDRLKIALGNLQEEVGNKLVPLLDKGATFIADNLPAALDAGAQAFDRVRAVIEPVIRTVVLGVQALIAAFQDPDVTSDGFVGVMERIGSTARQVFDAVMPTVREVFDFIGDHAKPILIGLGVAFAVLTAPVTSVVAALAYAYLRFQSVRDVVAATIAGVKVFARFMQEDVAPVVAEVVAYVGEQFSHFHAFVDERIGPAMEAAGHVFNVLSDVVRAVLDTIVGAWDRFGGNVLAIVGYVFDEVKAIVSAAVRVVRDVIDLVLALINGDWGKAWDALKDIVVTVLGLVVETVKNAFGILWELVKALGPLLWTAFGEVWDGIKAAAKWAFEGIVGLIRQSIGDMVDLIVSLPGRLVALAGKLAEAGLELGKGLIGGLLDALGAVGEGAVDFARDFGNAIIDFINRELIDRINRTVELKVDLPDLLGGGSLSLDPKDIPGIPRLAAGAMVRARPGVGITATIGEGFRDEAVMPLPPGLVEGLQAIAAAGGGGGGAPIVHVYGATVAGAYATGIETARALRAEQYRRTGR